VITKSLELLAKNQSEMGLIPNCVGSYNIDRQSDVTYNSIDAPLWFIIGHYAYAQQYNDYALLKKHEKNIARALSWLRCQDPDNIGLLAQQPTNDWFDAFPHKYGYTIHGNALYYATLNFLGEKTKADNVKKIINGEYRAYSSLYDNKLGFYLPWGWKNHDTIREKEEWFDTAGNLLAIVTGLATPGIAASILNHIDKNKINRPYPCKCLWPPLKKGDPEWKDYFDLCDARTPLNYSNAGIWPFIGGFYVAALIKIKNFAGAGKELELLATGLMQKFKIRNLDGEYEFNDWLHGETGKPGGEPYQAWSAGMFLYAYECVKRKKVIYF
jgi:glycogen debranching enzyme